MTSEKLLAKTIKRKVKFQKIKVANFNINYIKAGSGKPILLVHGANIGWGQWYKNIDNFAKKYTVYAIDLPGAGYSDPINYWSEDIGKVFVKVVAQFIFKLKIKSPILIGHSVGAWTVAMVTLVRKIKVDRLILVDPVGFTSQVPLKYKPIGFSLIAKLFANKIFPITKNGIRKFLLDAFQDKTKLENKFIDYYLNTLHLHPECHPVILIHKISSPFSVRETFLFKNSKNINIPTLFISGDKDVLVDPKQLKAASAKLYKSKVAIIKDSGHVPFIEKSDEFMRIVLQWLRH